MKIIEKTGIKQWFINKWTNCYDFEVDLTDDELESALRVGYLLYPEEKNIDKIVSGALEYWIVLYVIQEFKEEKENKVL